LDALSIRGTDLFEGCGDGIASFDDSVARNEPTSVFRPRIREFSDINAQHCVAIATNEIVNVSVDAHGETVGQ
jgi:hypothetical protein